MSVIDPRHPGRARDAVRGIHRVPCDRRGEAAPRQPPKVPRPRVASRAGRHLTADTPEGLRLFVRCPSALLPGLPGLSTSPGPIPEAMDDSTGRWSRAERGSPSGRRSEPVRVAQESWGPGKGAGHHDITGGDGQTERDVAPPRARRRLRTTGACEGLELRRGEAGPAVSTGEHARNPANGPQIVAKNPKKLRLIS